MTKVRILGSMGWMPARGQQTACVLVETRGQLLLLDAGTGVANLAMCQDLLARYDRLSILLSHYHLDHVCGLMYLKRFAAHMCVDVYGPGVPAYGRTTADYLSDLLQESVYSSGPRGFAREVHYTDYGGESFLVGDVHVGVRAQQHSAPSFELRIEDDLVYATDTCFDSQNWGNAAPARLLLHECWQLDNSDPRHTSVESLASGLPRDAFGNVVLVHQNPSWDEAECARVEHEAKRCGFTLAHDGMEIEI